MKIEKADASQAIFFALVTMVASVGSEQYVSHLRESYTDGRTEAMLKQQAYDEALAKKYCDDNPGHPTC